MDTSKMREQFEQRYPVPEGACWNAEQGRYVLFHLKLCTVAKYERFVENWVCWQASREAVVVEIEQIRSEAKRQEDGLKEMLRRQNKQICALRGKL